MRFGGEYQDWIIGIGQIKNAQVHIVESRRWQFADTRSFARFCGLNLWRGRIRFGQLGGCEFQHLVAVAGFLSGPEVKVIRTGIGAASIGDCRNDLDGTLTVLSRLSGCRVLIEILHQFAASGRIGLSASQDRSIRILSGLLGGHHFHGFLWLRSGRRRSGLVANGELKLFQSSSRDCPVADKPL